MAAFKNTLATLGAAGLLTAPKRPAPRVIRAPPEAFSDTWGGRPKVGKDVAMGLRLLSAQDLQDVRSAAARAACTAHPNQDDYQHREEAFHDAFCREVLAVALCRPEDASQPYWEVAQDAVFVALTPGGVRFLCEQYETLQAENDPLAHDTTDEQLRDLAGALTSGEVWGKISFDRARKARRLLGHVLGMLMPEA